MFTRYRVEADAAFGGWLMPVVPPMVSAATGALLIPHMAPGTGRDHALRLLCDVRAVARRVAHHHHHGVESPGALRHLGHGPRADVVVRAGSAWPIHHGRGLLGTNAALAVEPHLADGMGVFAILYGVPVWGFAVLWIALATA